MECRATSEERCILITADPGTGGEFSVEVLQKHMCKSILLHFLNGALPRTRQWLLLLPPPPSLLFHSLVCCISLKGSKETQLPLPPILASRLWKTVIYFSQISKAAAVTLGMFVSQFSNKPLVVCLQNGTSNRINVPEPEVSALHSPVCVSKEHL